MPPSVVEGGRARFAEPHPQFDPDVRLGDIQAVDLIGRRDDALGKAEPESEILKILGVAIITAYEPPL